MPKSGHTLEEASESIQHDTPRSSPRPSSSTTQPSNIQDNLKGCAGGDPPDNETLGSVTTVEDGVIGEEVSLPYLGPETSSSFERPEAVYYFPPSPLTVQSEDVVPLQSAKSPFPHSRERYPLGPLKGLPEHYSDASYTNLEEACLIRHFTEDLAPWVRLGHILHILFNPLF